MIIVYYHCPTFRFAGRKLSTCGGEKTKPVIHIDAGIQHGDMQSARHIINMDLLQKKLPNPKNDSGFPLQVATR